jgi:hypothetical protein
MYVTRHPFKTITKYIKLQNNNYLIYSIYRMSLLARHSKMQTKQLQHLNEQIEVRAARQQNIAIRNQWRQAQTSKNYQTEYDRIRSHLENNILPHETKEKVKNRKRDLEALGARAIDKIV